MRAPLRPRDICALLLVGVFAVAASGTHVVRSGESLHTIARDHGTTVRALVEANGIADPDLILAGQELTIPAGSSDSTRRGSSGGTYTVRSGDTLAGIAARHGTTVAAIAAANGISDPNVILIGRSLHLVGGGSGGGAAAVPSAQPGRGPELAGQRHTVRSGETIAGIARRYGIRAEDLIAWNGLVDGRLYATTRLVLFNPGTLPSFGGGGATSGGGTHTVTAGQTLSSIAARYGVSPKAIAEANGIGDPDRIRAGQRLAVPGSSGEDDGFLCPVPGGSFFNDWAFPRSGGRSHAGTDVFAARGTPVRAPVDGAVEVVTGSIGGKQFRLTTAEGHLLFGSHLHSFGAVGPVRAGDVIGTVGDTGNAAGGRPHLHFEVHPAGAGAVNPFPLLRSAC